MIPCDYDWSRSNAGLVICRIFLVFFKAFSLGLCTNNKILIFSTEMNFKKLSFKSSLIYFFLLPIPPFSASEKKNPEKMIELV